MYVCVHACSLSILPEAVSSSVNPVLEEKILSEGKHPKLIVPNTEIIIAIIIIIWRKKLEIEGRILFFFFCRNFL